MADIEVNASGPWFDGRARAEIQRICREAEDEIAAQTYAEVMGNLNRSIRHPTPYYETQIDNQRLSVGRRVHDRGVIYGGWLEDGRGRQTRFRGYHSFGRAYVTMQSKARALVERVVQRHTGSM